MRAHATVWTLALAVWLGCAPSHRMVHDGDVYFEHCYGADFDPRIRGDQREACWNAWLAFYTRHQPTQRIDYAMRRVEALQANEPALTLPGLGPPASTKPEPTTELGTAGLVTLHGPRAGAEVSTVLEADAPRPGTIANGCLDTCTRFEAACVSRCSRDGTSDTTECHNGCAHEKSICLHGCY